MSSRGFTMTKSVIIYSGGMDSFTLINILKENGDDVHALSFNYGQRHLKELVYAAVVCKHHLKVPHTVVDLSCLTELISSSTLTSDKDVPDGHYSELTMRQTVVPNRNMIMLSIAVGYAVNIGASKVYTAVHAGDHAIYPDCRKDFIDAMTEVTKISNYQPVTIEAPFIDLSKGQILMEGEHYGNLDEADYDHAWTCYKGREKPCGRCGACVERLEAFDEHGWRDPLEYEDREFYLDAIAKAAASE